jgi:1,4-dihydroxy-2-naphthoate octaprenyltransferase
VNARTGLEKLRTYPYLLLTWRDGNGYPITVAVDARINVEAGSATVSMPAGVDRPSGEVSLTGSHIRPTPGYGYDQRRHVTVWGQATQAGDEVVLRATTGWGWDEAEVPFFEYSERSVPRSRRYFTDLSRRLGRAVRPQLSFFWLALRATRLPFLSATFVPVLLGILIAAADGSFDLAAAVLTVVGAASVHLGLNVANDVFDTLSGADEANVNPTKYSGGSRVIQYGLVTLRGMALISIAFYAIGAAIGLVLLATRGSTALLWIGLLGIAISVFYTAPPFRLVYRGLGEIAVFLGFGPLMLLGAYVVQTRGEISPGATVASIPIGILVALILYVNEIPDRRADAAAGKRTLPTRWSADTVLRVYAVATGAAFVSVALGVILGVLPLPALLVFLGIPLALRVHAGLRRSYNSPYELMPAMALNIQLHLAVGGLLLLAYAATLGLALLLPEVRPFLR